MTTTQREVRWLLEEKYSGKRTGGAEKDIARLEKGEHIDYVIGWVDFLGCKIDLSQKPFIPRPETEYWAGKTIEEIKKYQIGDTRYKIHFLDLFAGSGCIGVTVLKHIPEARVDFAEKNKKFLKQIQINTKLNSINPARYKIIESDMFSGISEKYDYIFANPPYVAESRKNKVQKSVLTNEPLNALFAGSDGLKYIRLFLRDARDHLKEGGKIYMEFDEPQKRHIKKLLKECLYRNFEIFKDQYGKWRYMEIA